MKAHQRSAVRDKQEGKRYKDQNGETLAGSGEDVLSLLVGISLSGLIVYAKEDITE